MTVDTDDSQCGIYAITNLYDGKATAYVGSTISSFKERWGHHITALQRGDHPNCHLQRAWDRDGEEAFTFTILEVIDISDEALDREQHWLDAYRETGAVYNISIVTGSPMLGLNHTEETKRHLSKTSARYSHSEEAKQKIARSREKPYPSFLNINTGTIIPAGVGLTRMCERRGLERYGMEAVKNGRQRSSQGWILADNASEADSLENDGRHNRRYPAFLNAHTGERIPGGKNLKKMCRLHGLSYGEMSAVKRGYQKSHRGWILADHPEHADVARAYSRMGV